MKKAPLLFIIFGITVSIGLISSTIVDEPLQMLVLHLEKLRAQYPQEKVHLHMDKPFYSVGDDIWFKAYVVNAEQNELSDLSKVLHVDVVNQNDSVTKSLVLPLVNGLSQGDINLTDSLFTAGTYHIRAYTRWMQNFGSEYFFDKTIVIGDAFNSPLVANADIKTLKEADKQAIKATIQYRSLTNEPLADKAVAYSFTWKGKLLAIGKGQTDSKGNIAISTTLKSDVPAREVLVNTRIKNGLQSSVRTFKVQNEGEAAADVQFFPEGGDLVAGIRSKVAFKVTGANGFGLAADGYIEDGKGNKIAEINTSHAGMGVFVLQPAAGATYTAIISVNKAPAKSYSLPVARSSGYGLSLNHSGNDSIAVKVSGTADLAHSEVILVAQNNARLNYVTRIKMDGGPVSAVLSAAKVGTGIVQFTLFNTDYQPVAERLIFVSPKYLRTSVTADKAEYSRRQKVNLAMQVSDDVGQSIQGSFSVAVTDADKVSQAENNETSILSNLLLTADLKGYVEQPNYYFNNVTREKVLQLDALMLTQGWRRFKWADAAAQRFPEIKYKAENGVSVSGNINTMSGKPVPNGKVTLFARTAAGPLLVDTIADATGHFVFDQLDIADTAKVVVRAKNAKDRGNVKIVIDQTPQVALPNTPNTPFSEGITTASVLNYLQATEKRFNALSKSGIMRHTIQLKEVQVRDRRPPKIYKSALPETVIPDITLTPEQLQTAGHLSSLLQGVNGIIVRFKVIWGRRKGGEMPMLILLDGVPIDDIDGINPSSLAGVQIVRGSPTSESLALLAGVQKGAMAIPKSIGDKIPPPDPAMGIIYLTTERRATKYNTFPKSGVEHFAPKGYSITREFYSPVYEATEAQQTSPDLRSTIFWKPDLVTDEQGKGSVSFYTADEPGNYRIVIEGLDLSGNLVRKVSGITVH